METKDRFDIRKALVLFLAMSLGFVSLSSAETVQTPDQDTIIAKIKNRATETSDQIEKMTYLAESLTTVTGSDGKLERTVTSHRIVTFTPPDEIDADFLGMTINGRALNAKEIADELKKSQRKQGQSPFLPSEMQKYRFEVKEKKQYQDIPVWEVAFEPLEPGEGLAVGYAYVHQDTYDVVFMAFSPSQIPSVMKKMQAEMKYKQVQDQWFPASFKMNMHLKVEFIFTLADKIIDIEENYSDHSLQKITPSR